MYGKDRFVNHVRVERDFADTKPPREPAHILDTVRGYARRPQTKLRCHSEGVCLWRRRIPLRKAAWRAAVDIAFHIPAGRNWVGVNVAKQHRYTCYVVT